MINYPLPSSKQLIKAEVERWLLSAVEASRNRSDNKER
jgi:hypothetical protein